MNSNSLFHLATDLCLSWPKVLNLERGRALGCPSYISFCIALTLLTNSVNISLRTFSI